MDSGSERRKLFGTRRRRWIAAALAVIVLVALAIVTDLILIGNRISKVQLALPASGNGETYVIVGSDSRESLPPGLTTEGVGTTAEVPGSRADIVLILQVTDTGTHILSVPRDLLVQKDSGGYTRLALTLTDGPQELVNALCRTLNIPTDHLIIFNFTTFIGLVDELGGVEVQFDTPVRDTVTGLYVPDVGLIHLDGVQALALARSRHPEIFADGGWVALEDGAQERTNSAGLIFAAVREKLSQQKSNPLQLQRLAWSVSGNLTTDDDTGLFDLMGLADLGGEVTDLPGEGHDELLALTKNEATDEALRQAGFDQPCVPA